MKHGTLATLHRAQPPGQGQEGFFGPAGQHGQEESSGQLLPCWGHGVGTCEGFSVSQWPSSATCCFCFSQCLQQPLADSEVWFDSSDVEEAGKVVEPADTGNRAAKATLAYVFVNKYAARLKQAIRRNHFRGKPMIHPLRSAAWKARNAPSSIYFLRPLRSTDMRLPQNRPMDARPWAIAESQDQKVAPESTSKRQ